MFLKSLRVWLSAQQDCDVEFETSEEELTKWQTLFTYSDSEAVEQIKNQKSDYSRCRVSNDHWDLVRPKKEVEGYSREAYEHFIETGGQSAPSHGERKFIDTSVSRARSFCLVLLEGILSNPKSIQDAANLSEPPQVVQAASENRDAVFCSIDGDTKQSIENWLSQQKSTFRPTFVRLSQERSLGNFDLSDTRPGFNSATTSNFVEPELRHDPPTAWRFANHTTLSPRQDEYPVWYFFYCILADTVVLTRLLPLPEEEPPILVPASISGGLINMWDGKYKALVDGTGNDYIKGRHSKSLQGNGRILYFFNETDKYEVVRCRITLAR